MEKDETIHIINENSPNKKYEVLCSINNKEFYYLMLDKEELREFDSAYDKILDFKYEKENPTKN